jgi:hypothetical protein
MESVITAALLFASTSWSVTVAGEEPVDVDHDDGVILLKAAGLGIDNDECADHSVFE